MLHFHKVHTFLFYNNKALYQQILKPSLKYNIKINILYYPKSSSEINENGWVGRGMYLLYLSRVRWLGISKRNLARIFSCTFLVLVFSFIRTFVKMRGKCPVLEEDCCAGKASTHIASKTSSKQPVLLPWVLLTLCCSWYLHHIKSPVSDQGWFCLVTNMASAQVHFHLSYPGKGWWVWATRQPHYRADTSCSGWEARRKAEAMGHDGFHHRHTFAQLRLFLTSGGGAGCCSGHLYLRDSHKKLGITGNS